VSTSHGSFRINPLLIPWLIRNLKRDKIQLLHLHLPRAGFYGRFAAKLLSLPVLYTEHNLWESYVPFSRFLNRITYFLNNHVVAVSDAVQTSIRNHSHYPTDRQTRIYNGIPLYNEIQPDRRFGLRQDIGLHERTIIAGTIANLHPRKGIQFLLYALHHLLDEFPNLHCVIIGRDDGEEANLRRIVTQLGIENHIHWLGYRPDARHLLPMFDVFVLPSLFEGLPIALLEAMDAGLPVIATRVGGTPEVVVNGETGLLVDPGDVPALAISLRSLLVDSHKREQMGDAGRRRVREEFTIDRMAKRYAELYFNLSH
jgi:glycosyltransferase involved in cell wall biosynthesis